MVANVTQMEFTSPATRLLPRDGPGPDLSASLRNINVSMIICSALILCGRGYSRLRILKDAGWDDLVAVVAYVQHSLLPLADTNELQATLLAYDVLSILSKDLLRIRHFNGNNV